MHMQVAAEAPHHFSRNATLAVAVVALHAGGLYALQSGLLRRAVEVVVPVDVLAHFIEPAKPKVEPPPPPPAATAQTQARRAAGAAQAPAHAAATPHPCRLRCCLPNQRPMP
jgi:protein TonB